MNVNINKVIVAGRVTQPPQLKTGSSGVQFCAFSLAIDRRVRGADGQYHDESDFVNLTAFGKPAEQCSRFLQKGASVFVEARLHQESWKDKATNQSRHRLGLIAERVHFLDGVSASRPQQQAHSEPPINPQAFPPQNNAPRLPPRHRQANLQRAMPPAMPQDFPPEEIYDEPEF